MGRADKVLMSSSRQSKTSTKASPCLEDEGPKAFEALRASLAAVVSSVPGAAGRPVDLARTFGLDRKLAWKLGNVITGEGPDGSARYVPGTAGVKIFVDAARKKGVAAALLKRCERASETYRKLIRNHAGDRESLDVLVSALTPRTAKTQGQEIDLGTRRSAFRTSAAIWGVRAKVQYRAEFLRVSRTDSSRLDAMTMRGMAALQRMRPGERWTLFRGGWVQDTSRPAAKTAIRRPVDAEAMRRTGVPILPQFCQPPYPRVSRVPAPGALGTGFADDILEPGPVGQAGEVTVVSSDRVDNAAPRWSGLGGGKTGMIATRVRTPVELLLMDIYIERGIFNLANAKAEVLSDIDGTEAAPEEMRRLPCAVEVEQLPTHSNRWELREVAGYGQMITSIFSRVDWNPADFELLRVRVQYPVIPSAVMVTFELPPAP